MAAGPGYRRCHKQHNNKRWTCRRGITNRLFEKMRNLVVFCIMAGTRVLEAIAGTLVVFLAFSPHPSRFRAYKAIFPAVPIMTTADIEADRALDAFKSAAVARASDYWRATKLGLQFKRRSFRGAFANCQHPGQTPERLICHYLGPK
jgi:hypothetical protein